MIKKMLVAAVSLAALLSFGVAQAEVARAVVTTGVEEREPVNDVDHVAAGEEKVFFFTELRDMSDQSVTHVWKHNGEVMAEVRFDVGGPRWRVYSSKNMLPEWGGEWQVSVVDEAGTVLAEKAFSYGEAEAAAPAVTEEGAAEPESEPAPADESAADEVTDSEEPAASEGETADDSE